MFEEYCKKGIVTVNVKFKEFAGKWLNDFARVNLKKTTFQRMKNTTIRVYAAFGHLRVDSIRAVRFRLLLTTWRRMART